MKKESEQHLQSSFPKNSEIYLVGGAVRDKLLGLHPRDHDYVIINETPSRLVENGFIPVGKEHTVFLHPETREEYTLAEDLTSDLQRRDLTINAMAEDQSGTIIDPFNGRQDLNNKILRHVSISSFTDDPIRIFRVARLKCQLPGFEILPETLNLMQKVSSCKMTGERVLLELEKALTGEHPVLFFETLNLIGLNFFDPDLNLLDATSKLTSDVVIRFASLRLNLPHDFLPLSSEWEEAARMIKNVFPEALIANSPEEILNMFYKMDAFRKDHLILVLCTILSAAGKNPDYIQKCFNIARTVSSKDVLQSLSGKDVGDAIRKERLRRLIIATGTPD